MGVLWHRFDNDLGRGDIAQVETPYGPGNLLTDPGLITAIELSLFTDRRAPEGAVLPGGPYDLRGWWGDEFWGPSFELPQYEIGSLIWLLDRSKNRQETLSLLKDYVEDGVAWMLVNGGIGMIESATAVTERVRQDVAGFQLEVKRPGEPDSLWTPRWEKTISGI